MPIRFSLLWFIATTFPCAVAQAAENTPPNIVFIYADDMGYGDLGCYGGDRCDTPHIDRMAKEGVRFTDFYAAQPVCSASRAALLTGCYPNRVGILGALRPGSAGLSGGEKTIADVLKTRGYATAIYGKWHVGDRSESLPTRHGFDEYFGLPYSNDMCPRHAAKTGHVPPLPLMEGVKILETDPDQTKLTTRYTERAVAFIKANKSRPFFLYLPHSMPHVPLYVSEKFRGKSRRGLYGDVLMELDWSVGQVLSALKEHDLDENTVVIFASDNGPWLCFGEHAGSAGALREGKNTTWEGGVRVPFIARWPGRIRPGTVQREPAMAIDVLPTLAGLAGAELPTHKIDGKDIRPLLTSRDGAKTPHEALYFYLGRELQAVRSGKWKLHLSHDYQTLAGQPGGEGGKRVRMANSNTPEALYDLEKDPGETTDLARANPAVVDRLRKLADEARKDLGDSRKNAKGSGVRHWGETPTHPASWGAESNETLEFVLTLFAGPAAAIFGAAGFIAVLVFTRRKGSRRRVEVHSPLPEGVCLLRSQPAA